jgi:filamentous hemagglutinin family protein
MSGLFRSQSVILTVALLSLPVQADIVLDGSTGSSGTLTGPAFSITEDLGVRAGNNLIHSFSEFSLSVGEVASFSGDAAIENVISRVTGASASNIDGFLISTIADANFWFLNPNGVFFGANAQINVPASFIVSTASSISGDVAGGLSISQDLSSPVLSISDLDQVAFGVSTNNSIEFDSANMTLTNGDMRLVSRDLSLENASLNINDGELIALAGSGVLSQDQISLTNFDGEFTALESKINVGSASGLNGSMQIGAGTISMTGTDIELVITDDSQIKASGITLSDSKVDAEVLNAGIDVDLLIEADALTMSDRSRFLTETDRDSVNSFGADLVFEISGDIELNNSDMFTVVGTDAVSSIGGAIDITSENLSLLGNGEDSGSRGFLSGTNKGDESSVMGEFLIDIEETFSIRDQGGVRQSLGSGGVIDISVNHFEAVDAINALVPLFNGDDAPAQVSIDATTVLLDNANLNNRVTNNSDGGSFALVADELAMLNGSSINTKTFGTANGVDLDLSLGSLQISDGSFIGASTLGGGNGGNIDIQVSGTALLSGEGDTFASSIRSTTADTSVIDPDLDLSSLFAREGFGEGSGGAINLAADTINLENGAEITAISGETDDVAIGRSVISGNSGSISVSANHLELNADSSITTRSIESAGGNIDIRVVDFIGISDSTIQTDSQGALPSNPGGDIFIDPELLLFNNALINANANAGNGGNIDIIADNIIQDPSTVITASSNLGVDGDITIDGVINDAASTVVEEVAFVDVSKMLSQRCSASQLADRSSFIVNNRRSENTISTGYVLSSNDVNSGSESIVDLLAYNAISSCQFNKL